MRYFSSLLICLIVWASCVEKPTTNDTIKPIVVGVFDENGDNPYCIADAMEALKIDNGIEARIVSASDIVSGKTSDVDVYLLPGGSGRAETGDLGELGKQKLQQLVAEKGKGILGICAGAYALTETPNYPSLEMSGAEAIDIEHDHRGHGLAKFSLTKEGKKLFPELSDREIWFSQYYEGPVLIPAQNSAHTYTSLATMLSDVHTVPGTPSNMTNNKPFLIVSEVGKGKTASIIGHPEATPGMRWMIPRLVRHIANAEIVTYKENVVRPYIYKEEMLVTEALGKQQRNAYKNLWGNKEEKLKAMKFLVETHTWSAKKWIPPMLRDADFDIRLMAAKLTVHLERTDALEDLESAVAMEKDKKQKELLGKELAKLKGIMGAVK